MTEEEERLKKTPLITISKGDYAKPWHDPLLVEKIEALEKKVEELFRIIEGTEYYRTREWISKEEALKEWPKEGELTAEWGTSMPVNFLSEKDVEVTPEGVKFKLNIDGSLRDVENPEKGENDS